MPAMSDPKDTPADEHAPAAHGGHGQDENGHDEPLGPPDIGLWAAGIGGIAVAIVIAACFAFSTGAL
jgi:hypothetical protein